MAANNIYIQVDFNSQAAQQNVNALNQAIGQTGPTAQKSSQQATGALGSVNVSVQQTTKAFGELTTALAGLGISRIVSSMVQVGDELGRAEQMMMAFAGSAAEGAKVVEQIRAIAATSPFRFKDLEETARQMLGFGMAAKDVAPQLQIIAERVTAMGGSIENVNTIVRIFGRIMGKDFVGAMDLMRALPQQGIKVMEALRTAISRQLGEAVSTEDVKKFMKEGVLDPMETWRTIIQGIQEQLKGATPQFKDFSMFLKDLGDAFDRASELLMGPHGFGPALNVLAEQIKTILAPVGALIELLTKLPDWLKVAIVDLTALAAAVVLFGNAWKIFAMLASPAITVLTGLAGAVRILYTALIVENPAALAAIALIGAAIYGLTLKFPEETKKYLNWVGDLWSKIRAKVTGLVKEAGFLPEAPKLPELGGTTKPVAENLPESIKKAQDLVDEWSSAASKTLLQALSSPVQAVESKYVELFAKLKEKMHDLVITGAEAQKLRDQLTAAKQLELDAKRFEQDKKTIEEKYKLETERAKGAYEAQVLYIEALDEQGLRKKVAAVDKITALRVESAETVARLEDEQLQDIYNKQVGYLEKHRKEFEEAGIDIAAAQLTLQQEMLDKQKVIDQKAIDDQQKYRLEGWKKANDLIIEDQKRVFEAFKSEFEELFDAFTGKAKSIGQAVADVFKKLLLGEAKNIFATQLAAFSTELAGYGRPEPGITRGGILSQLFARGMPPRPPLPPPALYTPNRQESTFKPEVAELTQAIDAATKSAGVTEVSTAKFSVATDAYDVATARFADAVTDFGLAARFHQASSVRLASASESIQHASGSIQQAATVQQATVTGPFSEAFQQASQATGVSIPLLRAVARVESSMQPGAVSQKGALGLMQLMPATLQDLGIPRAQAFDVSENVMGGARQLSKLLTRYHGDLASALAAYNMGPAAFDRAIARGRPLPAETQAYVKQVQALMTQAAIAEAPPPTRPFELPPTRPFELPPTELPQPPAIYGLGGVGGGALTAGAMPSEADRTKQAGMLLQMAGLLPGVAKVLGFGGAGGGGAPTPGGLITGLVGNIPRLRALFGISAAGAAAAEAASKIYAPGETPGLESLQRAAGGPTNLRAILTSRGVEGIGGALASFAGLALFNKGLQQRAALATVGGGGLAGLGTVLMTPSLMAGGPAAIGAGVAAGGGLGLFAAGFQRGGLGGLGMSVGGGALAGAGIGFLAGGPIGAAIGAGIGAAAGLISGVVRLFVKTEQERIRATIKQVYGIDIPNRQILAQIQQIVDQKYGGSVSVGVRSQEVQDLVRLYALSTGQAAMLPRPMYAATIAQSTQGLQLQPVYQGGVQVQNPYTGPTTYQYQTAVASAQGLMPGTRLGVPGATGLINQQWQMLMLDTIRGNPSAVAMAGAAAATAGDSRLTTTQAMQEPLTALS